MNLSSAEEFDLFRSEMRGGQYLQALERLSLSWQRSLENGSEEAADQLLTDLPVWLAEAFLRGPCLVLAGQAAGDRKSAHGLIRDLEQVCRRTHQLVNEKQQQPWALLESVQWRCRLVRWVDSTRESDDENETAENLDELLIKLLQDLQVLLETEPWESNRNLKTLDPPGIQRQLVQRWPWLAKQLQKFAAQPNVCPLAWRDPALVLLTRLLAAVLEAHLPDATDDNPGPTMAWIPLAVDNHTCASPDRGGWLAQVEVRQLPGRGNGSLVPNLHHSSHIVPATSFQNSLAKSWMVVLQRDTKWQERDYEYRLRLVDRTEEATSGPAGTTLQCAHLQLRHYVSGRMVGESGTLAMAASLRAAAAGDALDPQILPSAWFGSTPDPLTNPRLEPVQGLGLKKAVREKFPELGPARWLLAQSQTALVPLEPKPLRAETFDDAYALWTQDGRATRAWRAGCVAAREAHFQERSFGLGSYVRSDVSRRHGNEWRPLKPAEWPALLTGGPLTIAKEGEAGERLRVRADSGLGKTTLLHWLAGEIAARPENWRLVPIVLEGLSDYFESNSLQRFCERLAERTDVREATRSLDAAQRMAWLQRKFEAREVVLLLDAFDQMDAHRMKLLQMLRETLRGCPVVLTGRAAELEKMDDASVSWTDVALQPFSEAQARAYLDDEELADRLFRLLDVRSADGKRLPGGILTIPLLLYLLRQFARDNPTDFVRDLEATGDLAGRPQLYELVLASQRGLIDKGQRSLSEEGRRFFPDLATANDALSRLAWLHLTHQPNKLYFDLTLRGSAFTEVFGAWKAGCGIAGDSHLEAALTQLNALTKRCLHEKYKSPALEWEWRHRSFLEFLAARWLARLWNSGVATERAEADQWLTLLHETFPDGRDLRQEAGWLLRYTLAQLDGPRKPQGPNDPVKSPRDRFALDLIRRGNPWVVYDSLHEDHLTYHPHVGDMVPWLVHRDWSTRDYRQAWRGSTAPALCRPLYENTLWPPDNSRLRDSACLIAGADLVLGFDADSTDPNEWLPKLVTAFQDEKPKWNEEQTAVWKLFQNRFVTIPAQTFDAKRFHRDLSDADFWAMGVSDPTAIPIGQDRELQMADFFVTNEVWELFEPGHRRWRDPATNPDDESPVVHVNWYMAQAFCAWLTAQDLGWEYGLPTEWEWEAAVRWTWAESGGHHVETKYWWGDQPRWRGPEGPKWLMNCEEEGESKTTTREEAIKRYEAAGCWHPSRRSGLQGGPVQYGLLDLHGNVWTWCAGVHKEEVVGSPLRILRGGSWRNSVFNAEASYRDLFHALRRRRIFGLRVVRRREVPPVGPASYSETGARGLST